MDKHSLAFSLTSLSFFDSSICTSSQKPPIRLNQGLLTMSDNMVLHGQSDPVKLRVLVIGYDPAFLASVSEFLHLLKHQGT